MVQRQHNHGSWTIEVPVDKWEQVIERFDDPPAPREGFAKTEAAYERLSGFRARALA
jgi:hypothetical protein